MAKLHELLDLLSQDIYTDAPEYSDRVARVRELLSTVCPEINSGQKMSSCRPQVGHLRLDGILNPRECATVLHGLRLIQCGGRIEGCAAEQCEHFDDYPALTDEEIDRLAERINLG